MLMKYFLGFMLLFASLSLKSQSHIQLNSGKTLSTFMFKDSEGLKDPDLRMDFKSYSGVSYNIQQKAEVSYLRVEGGLRKGGSSKIEDFIKYEWNFSYIDLGLTYIHSIPLTKRLSFQGGAGITGGYLILAEQAIGTTYFDLRKEGVINNFDFGINVTAGIKYKLNDEIGLFAELRNFHGLANIENDPINTEQVARNRMYGLMVGLSFNIIKDKSNEND
jgi:hypothetical protein